LIKGLVSDDEPDSPLIMAFLIQAMDLERVEWDDLYEWETTDMTDSSPISLVPDSDDDFDIPCDLPPPEMCGNRGRYKMEAWPCN
jgi:hypothetical protein